jgi:hypothetical protein
VGVGDGETDDAAEGRGDARSGVVTGRAAVNGPGGGAAIDKGDGVMGVSVGVDVGVGVSVANVVDVSAAAVREVVKDVAGVGGRAAGDGAGVRRAGAITDGDCAGDGDGMTARAGGAAAGAGVGVGTLLSAGANACMADADTLSTRGGIRKR